MTRAHEGNRRGGARRPAAAVTVGLVFGLAVAAGAGRALDGVPFRGDWGMTYGTLAFLVSCGATAFFGGRSSRRVWGGGVLAAGLGLLSAGAWLYIYVFQVPLLTREGAWLWPLAVVPAVLAALTVRAAYRRRRHGHVVQDES